MSRPSNNSTSRRSSTNTATDGASSDSPTNGFGMNFDLPRFMNIQGLQSVAQSINRSFSPQNLGNFMPSSSPAAGQPQQPRSSSMSSRESGQEPAVCDSCGTKFNFLKRKVRFTITFFIVLKLCSCRNRVQNVTWTIALRAS